MAQNGITITVTLAAAGTRQRVVTDQNSLYRYVPWAYFEALTTNAGLIFIGDELVADDAYMAALNGSGNDRSLNWNPFQYSPSPRPQCRNQNMLDLYNVWVDGSDNSDIVFVTVPRLLLD